MSIFNNQRIGKEQFNLDVEGIRRSWYTDDYFTNTVSVLEKLANSDYRFMGQAKLDKTVNTFINNGDIVVEIQYFTRRKPFSVVAGVDECLAILEECTGYYDEMGVFVNTYDTLEVEAVQDGTFAYYDGNPTNVQPVLKIRGRFRDFASLETVLLGILTEGTRIATNVYNALLATRGKNILFFPARFAHYKVQYLHGYAYQLAVQAYNKKYNSNSQAIVSTHAQGELWGAYGQGTMAHASIASFLGDTAETTVNFAKHLPPNVKRVALVDFNNDCIQDTLKTMGAMFRLYWKAYKEGDMEEAKRYKLFAVRPDTSGNMRDKSLEPLGDKKLDQGVNPRLIWALRKAIDNAYRDWGVPYAALDVAKEWCADVAITVTGGFNVEKIGWFEEESVPVDSYGVGSSLLENSHATNNDYTADVVKVKIDGQWHDLSKDGRSACDNPKLETILKVQEKEVELV